MKIGPVSGIEVFESASRQPGHCESWERVSRGIEQDARQSVPTDTEHQNSGAVLSPQSSRCGRPRAQTQSEHLPATYQAAPKPKLLSIGFSQTNSAKAKRKRDCDQALHELRHGSCHETDGAERWTHVLTLREDTGQTWNKENWIDALSRSTTSPERSIVRTKTDRLSAFEHGKAKVIGCNHSRPVLFDTDTVVLEGTRIPHGQLFQLQTNPRARFMGRWIDSKKRETSVFLLSSESSSRQRTIDWKGLDDEPRVVLFVQSNHPDHDCFWYVSPRRAQNADSVFHQSSSDPLCTTKCGQTHQTRLSLFCT